MVATTKDRLAVTRLPDIPRQQVKGLSLILISLCPFDQGGSPNVPGGQFRTAVREVRVLEPVFGHRSSSFKVPLAHQLLLSPSPFAPAEWGWENPKVSWREVDTN